MSKPICAFRKACARRDGFTLVELLVVIAIIGILVALLLPAVQAAREAARRSQCKNALKQTALAMLNFESSYKGLPPIAEMTVQANNLVPQPAAATSPNGAGSMRSWVIQVLPFMEEQTLADQINIDQPIDNQMQGTQPIDPQATPIESLFCPSDQASGRFFQSGAGGGLGSQQFNNGRRFAKGNQAAYVSPTHMECLRRFRGALGEELRRLSQITDGTTKTIMVAEVRTHESQQDIRGAWALSLAGATILAADMHGVDPNNPSAAIACPTPNAVRLNDAYSPRLQNNEPQVNTPNSQGSRFNYDWLRACPTDFNSDALLAEGVPCVVGGANSGYASPRSLHPGGVHASRCDGSVDFVRDDIERFLFARLVSIDDGQGEVEGQLQ